MDKSNIKNESIEISAIENGFIVKFGYQEKPVKKEDEMYWPYKSKKYSFNTWADVAKWVSENAITQPPQ